MKNQNLTMRLIMMMSIFLMTMIYLSQFSATKAALNVMDYFHFQIFSYLLMVIVNVCVVSPLSLQEVAIIPKFCHKFIYYISLFLNILLINYFTLVLYFALDLPAEILLFLRNWLYPFLGIANSSSFLMWHLYLCRVCENLLNIGHYFRDERPDIFDIVAKI